jgi:hypothetical protein
MESTNGEPAEVDTAPLVQKEAAVQGVDATARAENYAIAAASAPESGEFATPRAKRTLFSRAIAALAALVVAALAWFIPGAGHLVQRRWQRAIVFFIAVGGLAVSGYLMRGNVFRLHSQDPFGTLGFIADACSGVFYVLSRVLETAGPNVARSIGDYGTRFIAAAGIVNVLGICDAYEIARGRRR